MLLQIVLKISKDVKEAAEEIGGGIVAYTQVSEVNWGYEIANKVLSVLLPLLTAYLIHKLKKNYWETNRPFFKNIIEDLKKFKFK